MQLHCPECHSEILAGNINLATMMAKCDHCNAVFSFADQFPVPRGNSFTPPANQASAIMPQPPQMVVQDWPGDWSVSWRWFNWSYVPLAGFCVFWDGFLVFWYTLAFAKHGPLIMKLFPVLHVAVGVTLTYSVLTGFLNRTTVRIAGGEVRVRHFPLPWWGNRTMIAGTIQQLYCERGTSSNNNANVSYRLNAILGEGQIVRLLGGFRNSGEPKFLEQQMEKRLKIIPKPVVGECNN